jgi:imidazolonepropionase-like amidohydrolase
MIRPVIAAVVAALTTTAPASAQTLAITHVGVVDVERGETLTDRTILIDGDRIVAVQAASDPVPSGVRSIDGTGRRALPGLIDMHVHALSDPNDAVARGLPLFVAYGVTTVRDMGSMPAGIVETRRRLEADPSLTTPRLIASGPLLDGQKLQWYGDLQQVITGPAEVPAALAALQDQGIDFFKVYGSLSAEVLAAIGREASALGMPVAGHLTRAGGLEAAAAIGQRTLEHQSADTFMSCTADPDAFFGRFIQAKFTDGYTAYWTLVGEADQSIDWTECEAGLAALGRTGAYFTPTLGMEMNDRSRVDPVMIAYLPAGSRGWCEEQLGRMDRGAPAAMASAYAWQIRTMARVRAAGLRVLAGTDTQNNCLAPGLSLHGELERLVEVGLTPSEALAAATTTAAAALDRSGELGVIAPGAAADIVLLGADPLADIRATRAIEAVIVGGRVLDEAALTALRDQARARAAPPAPPEA